MRWLPYVNIGGLVVTACYSGLVVSPAWKPYFAVGAGTIFLIGLVWPLFAEYRALGKSFHTMESSFLQRTRKPYFPSSQMEVYPSATPSPVARPRKASPRFAIALVLVATLLVAIDAAGYVRSAPPALSSGKIKNF